MKTDHAFGVGWVMALVASLIATAGWITHIVIAISVLVSGAAQTSIAYGLLLLAGVFMPPVVIIHGIGAWFGAW